MAERRRLPEERTPAPPSPTLEGREHQLINYAVDLAEKQLLDGTASAQVITHYLKLASTREKLEQERLRKENILLEARASALANASHMEDMLADALRAFKGYSGNEEEEFYEG